MAVSVDKMGSVWREAPATDNPRRSIWKCSQCNSGRSFCGSNESYLPLPASRPGGKCGPVHRDKKTATSAVLVWYRRRPIFPPSCPGSIVSAEAFHFRVRDGNGWDHLALATSGRSIRRPALPRKSPPPQAVTGRCSPPPPARSRTSPPPPQAQSRASGHPRRPVPVPSAPQSPLPPRTTQSRR